MGMALCWMLGVREKICIQSLSLSSLVSEVKNNQTNACKVTAVIDTLKERTVITRVHKKGMQCLTC